MVDNIVLQTELLLALPALLPGSYHCKLLIPVLLSAFHNYYLEAKLSGELIVYKMYLVGGIPSNDWQKSLFRILNSLTKSKISNKKIVYCEGENVDYYNLIGFPGIEFWSLKDSRAIYFAAKNERERFALRDRDFLTTNEIRVLTNKPYFENYLILEYYCFENYLYHPKNIMEAIEEFDYNDYVAEITKQKNEKLDAVIQDYKLSRLGYTDFTDNDKKNMDENPGEEIVKSLKSNEFEVFYKFFDMAGKKDKGFKKSFNKEYLAKYNIDVKLLVQTEWFKQKVGGILKRILQ